MSKEISKTRSLVSTALETGHVELSIQTLDLPPVGDDDVVVRVEASPINLSDLMLLLGPTMLDTFSESNANNKKSVKGKVVEGKLALLKTRFGIPMVAGNEGAGTVIAAGKSAAAQALLGKTVAGVGGEFFAEHRVLHHMFVMPMDDGVPARAAASSFVNPMTALGMIETMRSEGFQGIIHTAAASNLGRMLNRLCLSENIKLINIVRREEQVELLKSLGAEFVVNSSSETFEQDLRTAIEATGAYLAFDALGGGETANTILSCMEAAASKQTPYSRYGTDTPKKVYLYGRLDQTPITLTPSYGFSFTVEGWLLSPFLKKVGLERMMELQARVRAELTTTFASQYTQEITLDEALDITNIADYGRTQTGRKYLLVPS